MSEACAPALDVAVRHRFGDFQLDVAFSGPADGITVLLGPSGAGKSATLAAIAGLVRPDHSRIALGAELIADGESGVFVPPERRRIAIVHQDARLFPHMPVEGNLRYGLKRAQAPHRIGFDDAVAVLGIGHLLDRRPHDLSGGERQRVALGRALLSQPRLLLLDEPVSALDTALRGDVLAYIAQLRSRFSLPMVHVTHSLDEARMLADRVVMIAQGRVTACGDPQTLLRAGAQIGRVTGRDGDAALVEIGGTAVRMAGVDAPVGAAIRITW